MGPVWDHSRCEGPDVPGSMNHVICGDFLGVSDRTRTGDRLDYNPGPKLDAKPIHGKKPRADAVQEKHAPWGYGRAQNCPVVPAIVLS
jgi:hypothetical protein